MELLTPYFIPQFHLPVHLCVEHRERASLNSSTLTTRSNLNCGASPLPTKPIMLTSYYRESWRLAAISPYHVQTRIRKHFIDDILVYLFAFRRKVCKIVVAIYVSRKSVPYGIARKSLEHKIHILWGKFRRATNARVGAGWHCVDINNFAICNNTGNRFRFAVLSRSPFLATDTKCVKGKRVAETELDKHFLDLIE